jgi:CheY-like chemotaxis protein
MARLLFIDDDTDTLLTLKKAVEMFGHQPTLASTGQQALQLAAQLLPDLIFVDHNLTDMSGLEVVGCLRQNAETANIPVMMLSAGPELNAAERAKAAGVREYLLKPVRLQTLLDVIKKYTSNMPVA